MANNYNQTKARWAILALAALTNTIVVAAPGMSMSVLFKEISTELHLDLVQVGLIWGISSLPGIVTVLAGGAIADRFGPKRVLILACLVSGLTVALRGLANDFGALLAVMFISGFLSPVITMNTFKTCGMWFSGRQMGLASGVLSMGMALGFMLGSLFSATAAFPLVGRLAQRDVFLWRVGGAACHALDHFPGPPGLSRDAGQPDQHQLHAPQPGPRGPHPQRVAARVDHPGHRRLHPGHIGLPPAVFAGSGLAPGQRRRRPGHLSHGQPDLRHPHRPVFG